MGEAVVTTCSLSEGWVSADSALEGHCSCCWGGVCPFIDRILAPVVSHPSGDYPLSPNVSVSRVQSSPSKGSVASRRFACSGQVTTLHTQIPASQPAPSGIQCLPGTLHTPTLSPVPLQRCPRADYPPLSPPPVALSQTQLYLKTSTASLSALLLTSSGRRAN